ncbi:FtsX-like permease family protein [Streptomyces alkaliphilus]|uniref:FtsX-like permease family protein n=1 Tax=Streptomyces alkaliphilus TaxID=1472722 RepID=A0A7W3TAK9_9ACTN|nr:ABC transporter permease [Streptomyces alkaliphilus]MBB0243125.1 FtsX-like permease family protein [Streptomyces alkaliphilus]
MTGSSRPSGATGSTVPTALRDRGAAPVLRGPLPDAPEFPEPPGTAGRWARDLWMGMRFALAGGREGLLRTSLTALGVGFGVAVLLLAAAVPNLISGYEERNAARGHEYTSASEGEIAPGERTVLITPQSTQFRGEWVTGTVLHAEGGDPALPPGITEVPAPGTMVVSPALRDLLDSPDAHLLTPRLPYELSGIVADEGLTEPNELLWYAGDPGLAERIDDDGVYRVDAFGVTAGSQPLHPVLLLMLVIGCVVLLLPVGAFIATAVRLGGERRDRRLAALRLLGTDVRATHRIAAGEALAGALVGLLVGVVVFLLGRNLLAEFRIFGLSAFSEDAVPALAIALFVIIGVPTAAVMVTLQAMRRVAVEPLGVVRTSTPRRRRLWWRLLPPLAGLALLLPLALSGSEEPDVGTGEIWQVSVGIVFLLVGATAVLPWLVEALTGRVRGGPVPFQLAMRRLQLDSGSASRAVSGVTIAVAGAIALQMFLTGITTQFSEETGAGEGSPSLVVSGGAPRDPSDPLEGARRLEEVAGVTGVLGYASHQLPRTDDAEIWSGVTIAECEVLVRLLATENCVDGAVYLAHREDERLNVAPGDSLNLAVEYDALSGDRLDTEVEPWTIPADAPVVTLGGENGIGYLMSGVFATPAALDPGRIPDIAFEAQLYTQPGEPDIAEHVRNALFDGESRFYVFEASPTLHDDEFDNLRRSLYAGAVVVMLLIGGSMAISTLEQMRERRRLLSVLVAFGTPRSTLAGSVLWQTALPVALGLLIAMVGGMGLGAVLLTTVGGSVVFDIPSLLVMTAAGAGVVLGATLVGMPSLYRMMRPQGLRTE